MVKKFNSNSKLFDLTEDTNKINLELLHQQLIVDKVPHEYSLDGIIIQDKDLTKANNSKNKVLWQA